MLRLKSGDRTAFEELMLRHRSGAFRMVWGMVRNEAVAEELTQEAFLRVYLAASRWEPRCRFRTWLYTIASNLALNWIRDHQKREFVAPKDPEAQEEAERRLTRLRDPQPLPDERIADHQRETGLQARVRTAVNSLSPKQRQAMELQVWRELSYQEIADTMGCTQLSVRSLLFRAHHQLRRKLRDEALAYAQ